MNLGISAYSACTAKGLYKNGELFFENKNEEAFIVFAKEAYRFLEVEYAKFFKMDELCKLAFLTAELLLSDQRMSTKEIAGSADIALILGNKNSSQASDERHFDSYKDKNNYFPSPAVFVYTLPNIMLGELCIRHGITGENTCFVMEEINEDFFFRYVQDLFEREQYTSCITGWVDYSSREYKAALMLVEKWDAENSAFINFGPDFKNLIPA